MKDKTKLLHERALMTCVIMLFLCIILKLFGVRWFDLDTSISILNKIDNVVMNNVCLSFGYSFVMRCVNGYLIFIIVTKQLRIKTSIFLLITSFGVISTTLLKGHPLSFILDTLLLLLLCLSYECKLSLVKEYFITFALNIIFQIISLFIRNLTYHLSSYGLVVSILLNLDYYIMLLILYLYLTKGGITLCSTVRHIGSSLANRLWKRHTEDSQQSSESKER